MMFCIHFEVQVFYIYSYLFIFFLSLTGLPSSLLPFLPLKFTITSYFCKIRLQSACYAVKKKKKKKGTYLDMLPSSDNNNL